MDPLVRLRAAPFSTAASASLISRGVLDGPAYRQLMHGAHQCAEDDLGHGRLVQAFRVTHGDGFVLLGPSAAWAHGACFADDDTPVVVAVPSHHRLRRTSTVVPSLARLRPTDVVATPFGPATGLGRTAVDLARGVGTPGLPLDDRVADVDALLRGTPLTAAGARTSVASLRGLHGLPAARRAVELCRDDVDSPRETSLRLLLRRGGLPEPLVQCPVVLRSRQVARLDLGWPSLRAGCEYDGAVHSQPGQARLDLRRHNLLREAGWSVLQVDASQLRRPDEVIRQVRALLDSRA